LFSWSQTTGTASYQINIRDVTTDPVNGPLNNFINNGSTFNSVTLTLQNYHAYKWNVYACSGMDATGTKTLSASVWFRFLNPPYLESPGNTTSTPPLPKVLSLTPTISWDMVPEANGYWFYLSKYPYGQANIIYDTGFPASTYTFQIPSGYLEPGGSYAWNMTSLWGAEESGTLSRALFFTVDILPTAPNTLSASGGTIQIGLGWNSSSANAYGQKLERRDGETGTWHQIADLDWNIGGYIDNNVVSGITYYYRVFAYNGIGNSTTAYSSGVSIAPPFTIAVSDPNSGSPMTAGASYTISWSVSGTTTTLNHFQIAYSLDNKINYTPIPVSVPANQFSYSWTIPRGTVSSQAGIKVTAYNSQNTEITHAVNAGNLTINLPDGNPEADFSAPNNITPGSLAYFSAAKSHPGNSYSDIVLYQWTIHTGTTPVILTGTNVSFQFNNCGSYAVDLLVMDSYNKLDFATKTITVDGNAAGTSSTGIATSADPVNFANGNYLYEHTDLRIPGVGFPFEFKRFYNSKFPGETGLPVGFGWTHSYNITLTKSSTNVFITLGDGSVESFFDKGDGSYIPAYGSGIYDSLINNIDGSWTLTSKEQFSRLFDVQGRLTSMVDKNGNTIRLIYTGSLLTSITDTAGRTISFTSAPNGCLDSITDPIGRNIRFVYDDQTNLVSAIDANDGTNNYAYINHQMTEAVDPRGTRYVHNSYDDLQRIVSLQSDAYTNQTSFSYDFINRITYSTNALKKWSIQRFDERLLVTNITDEFGNQQAFDYDTNRNRILIQDKNGNQTHYSYDALGNVTNKTDALGNVTSITYDARNNPISKADALLNLTTFEYNAHGNLITTTNALGHVNRVQYDDQGLPTILTDARGYCTTNVYDLRGNLVAMVDSKGFTNRFEYDDVGRKSHQIDALNRTNLFFYDNNDNLLYTVNPLGFTNSFTYDGNNNRISSRDPRGVITTNVFDLKDRLVAVIDGLNHVVSNRFDELDRKVQTWDARTNSTTYNFDDVGNLLTITNAQNEISSFSYDPNGNQTNVTDNANHTTRTIYDALNRRISTVDPLNHTNSTVYDIVGRVTATTNAIGQVTCFQYDGIGRLTNVIDSANQLVFFDYDANGNRISTTDPNGHSWTNVFDELNRVTEQDDAQGHKTIFHYDPVGNLTNKITPNGDSILYSYDALNRLTNIAYPSGPPVILAYDSVGNRTNMIDGLGTTTWRYDEINRLISVTDPYGQTVTNLFDENGNRIALTYPGNKVVRYGYDPLNRMIALTNWVGGIVTYGYDNWGNLINATNANGTTSFYGYDESSCLVTLTNAQTDASVIASYALSLDEIGNHKQLAHSQPLTPILDNVTNSYIYDSDNRLTAIDGQSVIHDANGNLKNIGPNSFTYDFENRLTQFSLTNASGNCVYDGLGNRLSRMVGGETRHFTLDRMGALNQVLVETDSSSLPIAYYVYGLGLAEQITPSRETTTYHFNIQGSTVALTDSTGKVTDCYAFDSFGVLANSDGLSKQPFRYLGRYGILDDRTGLLYARARYFDPRLGRFITQDPVTGHDSDSQSLNRFVYALNNPLRFIDINGLCPSALQPPSVIGFCTDTTHNVLLKGNEGQPSFLVSIIPIYGSARVAIYDFQTGQYVWASVNVVMAVSDLLLVKALVTTIGKVGLKALIEGTTEEGFRSFSAFKSEYGSAGQGFEWHHIVEQNSSNIERYGVEAIHNTANLTRAPYDAHRALSGFYSSIQEFTGGQTVRNWLKTQSFSEQYEFGIQAMKDFGIFK
jgi:RHS repeat-associated protein